MVRINISLNENLVKQIDSERGEISRSKAIRKALEYVLGTPDYLRCSLLRLPSTTQPSQ